MIKLTVAILTRNDERNLPELLQSIKSQSSNDFSLSILDNGSTDATSSIIADFDFPEISLLKLRNVVDTSEANGMKILFEKSPGRYISIVHGDDLLKPNYVQSVLKLISKNTDFDAITLPLEHFTQTNELVGDKSKLISKSNLTKFRFLNRLLVCGINPGVMPGTVFNRETLISNKLLEPIPSFAFNFDIVLWTRFARCHLKLLRSDYCQYLYRRHNLQSSAGKNNDINLAIARNRNFELAPTLFERFLVQSSTFKESTFAHDSEIYLAHLKYSYQTMTKPMLILGNSLNFLLRQSAKVTNWLFD